MAAKSRISAMSFAAAGAEPINREAMDHLLQSPSFRALANLLQDAVILIDSDENVAFLNLAAEKLLGTPRGELERYPLEKLLRRSDFDMDEWLGRASKSRIEGVIKRRDGHASLTATRRMIPLADGGRAYAMLTLRTVSSRIMAPPISETAGPEPVNLIFSRELERQVEQAVRAHGRGVRVLILGESGVGKTAIARHIHSRAIGSNAPFVHVNCGSIPETLFESEMFGYERGAFTGALQSGRKGWVEQAAGGTLFLDEVGEIPLSSQVKLLKFLEDATIQPIGSSVIRHVRTTVVTATNRNLHAMVDEGSFRRDLFFRIATFPVVIPPLRDRPDKGQLLDSLLDRVNRNRLPKLRLSEECRQHILSSPLRGNLREMRSIVDYLDIVSEEISEVSDLREGILPPFQNLEAPTSGPADRPVVESGSLKDRVQAYEQQIIAEALERFGSKRQAARHLGVDIATLIRKQNRPNP